MMQFLVLREKRIDGKAGRVAENAKDHGHAPAQTFQARAQDDIVSISAIWPTLMTGMIQLPGMPDPAGLLAAPRNVPVQLK